MSFFESVIQFFEVIFQFIENIIVNTISFIQFIFFLPTSNLILAGTPGLFPSIIGISIGVVSAVAVIKLVLGWGNS